VETWPQILWIEQVFDLEMVHFEVRRVLSTWSK